MNTQTRGFSNTRGFRIGLLAVLAVAALAAGAFWYGTGLQADTAQSVARSPLGSSLTAIRESRLDDYYGRLGASSAAVASASPAASRLDDYFGRLSASSAAVTSASPASSRLDDYFGRLSASSVTDSRLDDYYGRQSTWTAPGR
jgi:hypothetical protein